MCYIVFLQEQLEAMEEGLEKAQHAFSQLDAQMSQSSQTATKIGDRLHVRLVLPCLVLWTGKLLAIWKYSVTELSTGQWDGSASQCVLTLCGAGQNAEGFRQRALEGIKVVTYLQEFANVSQLSELSELFQDDNRLAEAAVRIPHPPFW